MNREAEEKLYLMLKEREGRVKKDPLTLWKPWPKQKKFIDSVLDTKFYENWFVAANRSGKSDSGAYCGSQLARFGTPNTRYVTAEGSEIAVRDRATAGWVASLSYPFSRDVIQPKYFDNGLTQGTTHPPFIPQRELLGGCSEKAWHKADQILRLKNGSIIGFKSCEAGASKFQGAEKDWIHFDEVPPEDVYEEATLRVAAGKALRIFGTATLLPDKEATFGMNEANTLWLFSKLIQPIQRGERTDIGLFGASIYDNGSLLKEELIKLETRYPLDSVVGKIRLLGEYLPGMMGAIAYHSFNRLIHIQPQDKYYSPYSPLLWTWDFNIEPMVTLVCQKDGGIFRILRELYLDVGSISAMVDLFKGNYPNHEGGIWVYGDFMGNRRDHQSGQSDYTLIMNGMSNYPSYITLKVPSRTIAIKDRLNAMNVGFKDESGEHHIEIDPSCVELIKDCESVLLDARGQIKKSYKKRDRYFYRTHSSDALGYLLVTERPVTSLISPMYNQNVSATRIKRPRYVFNSV